MKSLNKCLFTGNLSRDIELKTSKGGKDYCKCSIAVSESYKDQQGNWQDKTEWVNLTVWGSDATYLNKYAGKGSEIFVECKYTLNKYKDKDGNDKQSPEFIVQNVKIFNPRKEHKSAEDLSDVDLPEVNNVSKQDDSLPF